MDFWINWFIKLNSIKFNSIQFNSIQLKIWIQVEYVPGTTSVLIIKKTFKSTNQI